jgi:lipopolysaccharide export system permease protein
MIGLGERYIASTLLAAIGLVTLVLLVLGGLFLFIGEQGSVGVGHYGFGDAAAYALMNLPRFGLQSLPAGVLIGAMLGIGSLARSHEITALRAAGMGKWRLIRAALAAGVVVVALALAVGELVAPRLETLADERKAFAKYNDISFAGQGGAWMRDGDAIINVSTQSSAAEFGTMVVYQFGSDRRLRSVARADHATASGKQVWQLYDYAETSFDTDRVSTRREPQHQLASKASADFLQLAVIQPAQMSLVALRKAIDYRRSNELSATAYVFEFWSQIAGNVGLLVAVVFALPFGFGGMRSARSGARLVLGLVIGIVYFSLQRVVGSGVAVFDLSPPVLAWLPTGLLLLAAVVMLWRAR